MNTTNLAEWGKYNNGIFPDLIRGFFTGDFTKKTSFKLFSFWNEYQMLIQGERQ